MDTKKVIPVLLWMVLAYALVATIVTICQDNKPQTAQLKPQKFTEKNFTPPATDEFGRMVVTNAFNDLIPAKNSSDPFSDLPNANGTPAGAWAATLVRFDTDANLYRDPATGKKYRVVEGKMVEETNPYAGLSTEALKNILQSQANIAQIMADSAKQEAEENRQNQLLLELRRANDIAERKSLIIQNPSPSPISIYGNSTQIGGAVFHNYYSSDGQSLYGNTIFIGNAAFTTLYGN